MVPETGEELVKSTYHERGNSMVQNLQASPITLAGEIVVFTVAGKEYGLPVEYVTSIEKVNAITRVPNVKPYIKGVMNLRGIIVPVLDLRCRYALEETPISEKTRILIIDYEGIIAGFIVDAANDVLKFTTAEFEEQPEVLGMKSQNFIEGVVHHQDRLIILLDLRQILELTGDADHEATS